jgi:hypothetical protein
MKRFQRVGLLFIIIGLNKCATPSPKEIHRYQPAYNLCYVLPCETLNTFMKCLLSALLSANLSALSAHLFLGICVGDDLISG